MPTPQYMNVADFAAKVEWEGGVIDTLEYGLTSAHLDPADDAARPLRQAWAALETAYAALRPLIDRVDELLEECAQ